MFQKDHKVAAVLVTYNRLSLLKRAIDSLEKQSYRLTNIVIVNNNSTDGTYEYLESIKDTRIKCLHLETNTGGAGGFSAGIKFAYTFDIDYIWIMDDDAVAEKDALNGLMNADIQLTQQNVKWGFLCSHVLSEDNDCMNVPAISNKKNSSGYLNWPEYASSGIIGVDKATFVSVIINRETVKSYGLPVRQMFIWGDDTEYTWRISNNLPCYYVSGSIVYHKRVLAKSLSLATEDNNIRMPWYGYLYRNNLYNVRKHGKKANYLLYVNFIFKEFVTVLKKSKSGRMKKIGILLSGVFKGIFFNPKIEFPE